MKSILLMVLAALVLPWHAFAQVASIEEGANLEERPGVWRRVLANHSGSDLLAFRAPFHCPNGGLIVEYDALLYSGHHRVAPEQSILMEADDPSKCIGSVNAAIFADGHAEGDPKSLSVLYSTREGAYKALGEATESLRSIQSHHESIQRVVDTLTARRRVGLSGKTASGYSYVLYVVLRMLTDSNMEIYGMPSDDPTRKRPSIEDVMNATGLTREEARAIVIGKRLEAWKSLLENNLHPTQ